MIGDVGHTALPMSGSDEGRGEGASRAGLPHAKRLIVLFGLLFVATAWVVALLQAQHERSEAVASALRENVNRVVAFDQYVTRTLDAADMATLHFAAEYVEGGGHHRLLGTPRAPALISDPLARNEMFAGFSVADARGNLIASTMPLPRGHGNVSRHPAFAAHAARDTGRLFVSAPRQSKRLDGSFIWLTRRLNNPDGSFAGVISVNIAPTRFTDFTKGADFRPTDLVSVIGLDGITRARRTGDVVSFGEDLRGKLVMSKQRTNPNGTYLGPSVLDGQVRYFSHRRLKDYPLFVTSGVALSAILAPVEKRALAYFIGAAVVTMMTLAFVGLLIVHLDRRQKQADAINEANRRLQEAQRVAQIGDWDYDLVSGAVRWSPQLCAMYERDPSRSILNYSDFESYLDEEGQRAVRAALDRVRENGEREQYAFAATLPSGTVTYHEIVAVPVLGPDGEVVRLYGTDQDVTSRKLVDSLQQEVAHLSRVDAMNAMATTLAHELNQPLTAAANYLVGSRRLLDPSRPPKPDLVAEGMRSAEQQVLLAAQIIRRVRGLVSNEPRPHEISSLAAIVADAVSLVSVANSYPRVLLRRDIARGADAISADSIQVQQVLMNLIRNACEATAGVEHPLVTVRSRRHGADQVIVSVSDNGPGVPASAGDLFSPFVSSKRSGLGLGLSISRTIVEAHGGRIWVEETGDAGTRISFTLPMPAAEEPELKIA
jgi:C4-dicarboxylate-specific signal transduction histidine kinase